MNEQEILKFEEITDTYSFGFHQNVIQFFILLEQHGYTYKDLKKYVPARVALFEKQAKKARQTEKYMERKCPECRGLMILLPVNDRPGNMTGDDTQSVWFCQKQTCQETIYNKDTIDQIVKKGLASKKKKRPPRYRK